MALSILGPDGNPYQGEVPTNKVDFGKTKDVFDLLDDKLALRHNGVLTANDDPKFTGIAEEKGIASAYSSALLFKRIEERGVETSHQGILNANTTLETSLDMLPFEIIWRRYNVAKNSWEKRNPGTYPIGERYPEIIYEACLKWSVIDSNGEIVHDPFLVLDDNFQPKLRADGMPSLMHSKEGKELNYNKVLHPNKSEEISQDKVQEAINTFTEYSGEIREMFEIVQEVTFDTYAQSGRLNGDGKGEVGLNKDKKLTLGDEIELDSVRNMALKTVIIDGKQYTYEEDMLGKSLEDILQAAPEKVSRIVEALQSGKQHFRNKVDTKKHKPHNQQRIRFNNRAAQDTTREIYIPTALALSNRFGKEVGFILLQS